MTAKSFELSVRTSSLVFVIYLFAFFRPLSLLHREYGLAGLNPFELFAIIISYLLIITIFFNLRNLKLDSISILILGYCSYCLLSLLWGSDIRQVMRVVLPFLLFFAARVSINNNEQIRIILIFLILGYAYPILGSMFDILQGISVDMIVYQTGVERYKGQFFKIHAFGHSMAFFSFIYALSNQYMQDGKKIVKILLFFLFLASIFCLFKSYVRTAFLGFLLFWGLYLWGYRKRYFALFLVGLLCIVCLYMGTAKTIFFQVKEGGKNSKNLDVASSGRLSVWKHDLKLLSEVSIERKILGAGIVTGYASAEGKTNAFLGGHNDFLELVAKAGILGLLMYLSILSILLIHIIKSKINIKSKYLFLAMVVSVIAMNFVSNSYVARVELAQLFWLFVGIFYFLDERDFSERSRVKVNYSSANNG